MNLDALKVAHLFFVLVGAGYFAYGILVLFRVRRMRSWPSVPAEIVGGRLKWVASEAGAARTLKAEYRYVVEGQTFLSSRITISDFTFATGELLIRAIARNHILPGPRAYFDPRSPKESVLVRPGYSFPLILFSIAMACFSVPILRGLSGLSSR